MAPNNDYSLKNLERQHADEGGIEDFQRSDALASDQAEIATQYWWRGPFVGAIASLSMGTCASYWGFSPPAAILGVINADIGPSDNSALFSIIWSTCASISILLFGRITDKLGRRWFMIGASCMGFIGGIIACTAQNMNSLIGANVLLGLSGGVHSCYSLTVGEICPNKYKLLGIVCCVWTAFLPTGFGAYLAIRLTHTANWRWCYYIYLILMGVAIILQVLFYKPPSFHQLHGGKRTYMQEVKRIDFVGIFLLVAGLAMFLLGVSWGGSPLPWTSGRILGLIITGGVVLIFFVFWEIYSKVPNPIVPMYLFKDVRGFTCMNIIGSMGGTIYVALSIIWPSQVANIYGAQSDGWATNAWLSSTIGFGIEGGIVIFGALFHVIKHPKWQLIVFLSVTTAFCGALATADSSNKSRSAAFSFLATFPGGILELIPAILVQMDSDDADLGTVFSVVFAMRTAMGSIFAAIFVAILNNKAPTKIAEMIPPAALKAGLPESSLPDLFKAITAGTPAAYAAVPGITTSIQTAVANALSNAYSAAYAYVYYAAVAVGLFGLMACICMKDYDHLLNTHVPRQVGNANDRVFQEKDTEMSKDVDSTTSGKYAVPTAQTIEEA